MAADSQSPWEGGRQAGSRAAPAPLHRARPLLRPGNQFILFCLCSLNAQRPDRAGSQGSCSRCQESGGWGWKLCRGGGACLPSRGQPLAGGRKSHRGAGTAVSAGPPSPRRHSPGGLTPGQWAWGPQPRPVARTHQGGGGGASSAATSTWELLSPSAPQNPWAAPGS